VDREFYLMMLSQLQKFYGIHWGSVMNDELERIWKEVVQPILQYYTSQWQLLPWGYWGPSSLILANKTEFFFKTTG
jgi:hypothetical protein